MNTQETALFGLVAAVFSIVCSQFLGRAVGHHAQLSSAQASAGLAICLAGVAVGVLFVLGASAFQEATSAWGRSLGAFGFLLGCALLLALLVGRRPTRAEAPARLTQESASSQPLAMGRGATSLAPGVSR